MRAQLRPTLQLDVFRSLTALLLNKVQLVSKWDGTGIQDKNKQKFQDINTQDNDILLTSCVALRMIASNNAV